MLEFGPAEATGFDWLTLRFHTMPYDAASAACNALRLSTCCAETFLPDCRFPNCKDIEAGIPFIPEMPPFVGQIIPRNRAPSTSSSPRYDVVIKGLCSFNKMLARNASNDDWDGERDVGS